MYFALFRRESSFGIRDRHTENVYFKFVLNENCKEIWVWINGEETKEIVDDSLSKEQLAYKSVKYITNLGR